MRSDEEKTTFKAIEKDRYGLWKTVSKHLKKQFIKFFIKQRNHPQQISMDETSEMAVQVREFVKATLQVLSRDLYKGGLQYHIRVACPYCQREKCSSHNQIACSHEDCLHLLEVRQGVHLICKKKPTDEVLTVKEKQKWFSQTPSKVGSTEISSLSVLLACYV